MDLTTSGGGAGGFKWYDQNNSLLYTGNIYNVTKLPGTHTFKVKALSGNNCESQNYGTVTLTVPNNCDQYLNWSESIAYGIDANGNEIPIAASKSYADGFGQELQSQSKSFVTNQVFASQPVYDQLGNAAGATLPAPVNSSSFAYRHNFMLNNVGQRYSVNDFDLPTTKTNPVPVGNTVPGTLGWYYSTNNTTEPNTPTTSFPYSRSYTPSFFPCRRPIKSFRLFSLKNRVYFS